MPPEGWTNDDLPLAVGTRHNQAILEEGIPDVLNTFPAILPLSIQRLTDIVWHAKTSISQRTSGVLKF
jgi:hypothetical protein